MQPPAILARRFVAGSAPGDAIRAGVALKARGINATFDLLGEDVFERPAAERTAQANIELLKAIPTGVDRNVSIKLTSLGLDIAEDFCLAQTSAILDAARSVDGFVRIDMEGSKHTQKTLDAFRKLRKSYDNVGIVLQAYLHRTSKDVDDCIAGGDRVRLCKGAYKEPADVAIQDMPSIRRNYLANAEKLLTKGNYPAIATHDEELVQGVQALAKEKGVAASKYEFQMLYGLRPKRWDELVRTGHNVRIYVPYGTHWFPYFTRRLRERKENVFFVLKSLITG
jgi:proline dehydrogenase